MLVCPFLHSWNVREGSEVSVHSSDHEYWAKGTGFGSGSLRSGWNMDRVRERQKKSERLIESIFKVGFNDNATTIWLSVVCGPGGVVCGSGGAVCGSGGVV